MAVSSTSSSVSASTVTETVYPVMVNGTLCYSAAEVAAVKSGQSPDSVKLGYTSPKNDETAIGRNQASTQTQSQAEIQAQAQSKQLAEAHARIVQFSQLSQDEQRQQQEESRRGQLVDFYA